MLPTLRALRISVLLTLWSVLCIAIHLVLSLLRPAAVAAHHIRYHRGVCAIMNVRIHVTGELALPGPLLVTCNHTSWLDIPILGSLSELSFVAKSEVQHWPVFGLFAKWQRSVFIDRERRRGALEANTLLTERLIAGDVMILFAEGTSSDGNRVLPFKSAIIGAAEQAAKQSGLGDVRVQPWALAYTRLRGMIMDRRDRPYFAWIGEMELLPHMWNAFKKGPIDVTVAAGKVHMVSDYPNRKVMTAELERECRRLLASALLTRDRGQIAHAPEGETAPEPAE